MQKSDQIAILGPTASGKSSLAVEIAKKHNGVVLSLDSLSIYKQIDIASAKPTIEERGGIEHFGIDVLEPDEHFDVTSFIKLYRHSREFALKQEKLLVIVGGTGFYLKMLIDGISPLPRISDDTKAEVDAIMLDTDEAYRILTEVDAKYAQQIKPTDKYRIEKALSIYLSTDTIPTDYFRNNPPKPVIHGKLPIYEIDIDRTVLRKRISERTERMFSLGLVDEVCELERRYTRAPSPMKAIGIREVLDYLDGVYNYDQMREKIISNTARLAKRQSTFNNSQFNGVVRGSSEELWREFQIQGVV